MSSGKNKLRRAPATRKIWTSLRDGERCRARLETICAALRQNPMSWPESPKKRSRPQVEHNRPPAKCSVRTAKERESLSSSGGNQLPYVSSKRKSRTAARRATPRASCGNYPRFSGSQQSPDRPEPGSAAELKRKIAAVRSGKHAMTSDGN